MTSDEAKLILQAFRPSGRDAGDPFFTEALEQVRRDPALAGWFQREQAHAAAISATLATIKPPAGLRAAILAGAEDPTHLAQRRHRSWWRRPGALALAASIAILISLGSWWCLAPVHGATFDEFAVNFVVRRFLLQKRGSDVAELKSWLAAHDDPLPRALPAAFAQLRALGCRTVVYDGEKISLVCFKQDGKEFHVFVAKRGELPETKFSPDLIFSERRGHAFATWSDAENHYVLVSDAGLNEVRRLFGAG